MTRSFSELQALGSFRERFEYLRLGGSVGQETFGFDRYLNQNFYKSREWTRARDSVIIRDGGCDLGLSDFQINGRLVIHHMNPININDIVSHSSYALDPEYLICVSVDTHLAIHYGDPSLLPKLPISRSKNDTTLWTRLRRRDIYEKA